jgi:hypothetical protein
VYNVHLQNGYTALIRAIVWRHLKVVEALITERPALKVIPDNVSQYPVKDALSISLASFCFTNYGNESIGNLINITSKFSLLVIYIY